MKHEYSTQQIEEASDLASNGYTRIGINFLLDFLDHLPEPVAEDWQECEFAEVKDTDEAVLFVFHDGAKIQGKPYLRTADQINIWVGNVSFHISKLDTTKGKARIYRTPATVQHPDPVEHPVIVIKAINGEPIDVPGNAMFWGGHYRYGYDDMTIAEDITDWSPAKVVEDDR